MNASQPSSCTGRHGAWILGLSIFLAALYASGGPVRAQVENISRGEFIAILARHQPDNPLLPKGHAKLSDDALYSQTALRLKKTGFSVLDGKPRETVLKEAEYVTLIYAFTGAPAGKSLLEQKLFLKDAGIVDSKDIGLATGVEGKVYQTSKGDNFKRRTQLASPVFLNDRIDTAVNSKVSFTFDDGSTLSLAENAKVNISKHIYDPEKNTRQTVINVSLGAVRFVVTKAKKEKGSSFQVVTPVGIAGVRGTEFVVSVDKDGKTTFVVLEGTIETMPVLPDKKLGKPTAVTQGEAHQIDKEGNSTEVKPASKELLQKVKKETSPPASVDVYRGITRSMAVQAAIASKKFRTANKGKIFQDSVEGEDVKTTLQQPAPTQGGNAAKPAPAPAAKTQKTAKTTKAPGMVFQKSAVDAAQEMQNAPQDAMKEAQRAAKEVATKEVKKATLEEAAKEAKEEARKMTVEEGKRAADDAAKQMGLSPASKASSP